MAKKAKQEKALIPLDETALAELPRPEKAALYYLSGMPIKDAMLQAGYTQSYAQQGNCYLIHNPTSDISKAIQKYADQALTLARTKAKATAYRTADIRLRTVDALAKADDETLLKIAPRYEKLMQSAEEIAGLRIPDGARVHIETLNLAAVMGNTIQVAVNPVVKAGKNDS